MFTPEDLFAKALMVEKPRYIHEIKFDQQAGKLEIWIDLIFDQGLYYYTIIVSGLTKAGKFIIQ